MSERRPDRSATEHPGVGERADPLRIGLARSRRSLTKARQNSVVPIGVEEPPSPAMTSSTLTRQIDELTASLPVLLTIDEAAEVLRTGRTLTYDLVHRYEASGGMEGLPVLRFGSCLRVPRWALIEFIISGRVVQLDGLTGR
ncbi:hypothetical protein BH18ACT2_BH18ACT2_05780 [soil metagenome]